MNTKTFSLSFAIVFLLLISNSFAIVNWLYSDATGKVCFNLTSDGFVYGQPTNTYYTVPIVKIFNNQSFSNSSMKIESGNTLYQLYTLSYDDSNSAYIAFVSSNDTAIGNSVNYCIYSGGSSTVGTSSMQAGYYNTVGGYFETISKINISNSAYYTVNGIIALSYTTSTTNLTVECNTTQCNAVDFGASTLNRNIIYRYDDLILTSGNPLVPTNPTSQFKNLIYYENFTKLQSFFSNVRDGGQVQSVIVDNKAGNPYVSPSLNNVVWNIQTRNGIYEQNFTANNLNFDFRSSNIQIQSPLWNSNYLSSDSISLVALFGTNFDNCTFYLNDIQFDNRTSLSAGTPYATILTNTSIGINQVKILCLSGGVEQHNYVNFFISSGNPQVLFGNAFGISLASICNGTVINELSKCTEYYSTNQFYNFASVVCPSLNQSLSYSCITSLSSPSIGQQTKVSNSGINYTIFVSPSTWAYPTNDNVEHIGMNPYYNGLAISGGMELYSYNRFIYIPAQNKTRDCGIYYMNTSYCSWWSGFVLNNGDVYIADRQNNWFKSGGLGISGYNENVSQWVINNQLLSVANGGNISDFGMFVRTNCMNINNTYNIFIQNTQNQLYTLTVVTGTNSYIQNINSTTLAINIPLSNITLITVAVNGKVICSIGDSPTLFLPSGFKLPFTDGFNNLFPKVIVVMGIILSTMIPYALFGVFIFNDLYGVLNNTYIGALTIFALIGGLVNNISPFERGIKHMMILMAITMAYITSLESFQQANNLQIGLLQQTFLSFRSLIFTGNLYTFTLGIATFIINVFVMIIFLPVTLIQFIYSLIYVISPVLATSFSYFESYLETGAMLFFYLKAYEVISNRFRIV